MTHTYSKPMLIALAALCTISPAQAEDMNNWYISGGVGITSTNDADFTDTGITGDFDLDNSVNFAGALGLHLTKNIRTEIELSYRKADLDQVAVDNVGSADVSGDLSTFAGLLNVYYDFMADSALSPYVSAGIGFARHDSSIDAVGSISFTAVEEDDTVFAYQLGAGASYDVADNTSLYGGYRYFGSSDPEFDTMEAEYGAHEFRVGVRYGF